MDKKIDIKNKLLKKVAIALKKTGSQHEASVQFCATDEIDPTDIYIKVDELGPMALPVSNEYIQQLISISSKAKFGLREQTISDKNVRDTYEIKSDKFHVTINKQRLTDILSKIRDRLGLSKNCVLTAHLHNMLIYQPGQFFDMHQDSEKLEGMVASLVIVLPSPHIGGDLIIKHNGDTYVFSSENVQCRNAKCIAFYTDCQHKVEKIKDGYRIALTYNLVLKPGENYNIGICSLNIGIVNKHLRDVVKCYFNTKTEKEPQMLVYFLNHSYTEHSLRWSMLKGTDRANASALCGVAQKLSLIPHLALAEIKRSWNCGDGPFDSSDSPDSDPPVIEYYESWITLSYWIDSNNKKLPFNKYLVSEDQICWTKGTESFVPFDTYFDGFTGNEGSTKDFWYKRAAIILWHESSQITINFVLNFDSALNALNLLISSPGNEKEAIEIVTKAGKHVYKKFYEVDKNDFKILANIALYVKNKKTALSILSDYTWEIIKSNKATLMIKLQNQYGIDWCIGLLNNCKTYNSCSITEIYSFVQNFLRNGGGSTIVEVLLDILSNTLIESYNDKPIYWWWNGGHPTDLLVEKMNKFYEFLAACAAINNTRVVDKVIEHLISNQKLYPNTILTELLLKLHSAVPSEYFSNYERLRSYVLKSIDSDIALLMQPNWTINAKLQCECEHCKIVKLFLQSRTEMKKVWPIKTAVRSHVINRLNSLNLPIRLSIERTGIPYKLIIVKTEVLEQNVNERFNKLKIYQQKLKNTIRN